MNESDRNYIQKHLPSLIETTRCTTMLFAILISENILTEEDVSEVEASVTPHKQATKLYNIISKNKNSFHALKVALLRTKQYAPYDLLNQHVNPNQSRLKSYGLITFDGQVVLGKGSNGTKVYQGTFDGRIVAVKVISLEISDVEKCLREIELLKKIDLHRNVVQLFHAEKQDTLVLIAMELCTMNLKTWINSNAKSQNSVTILMQLTEGLVYLHDKNILHGDLKPENILLCNRVDDFIEVKISDFGLSREGQAGLSHVYVTAHGVGTAGWMPAEIIEYLYGTDMPSSSNQTINLKKFSKSVDIFSLGCIFFYVLSNGHHPFGKRTHWVSNITDDLPVGLKEEMLPEFESKRKFWYSLIESMIRKESVNRPPAKVVMRRLRDKGNSRGTQMCALTFQAKPDETEDATTSTHPATTPYSGATIYDGAGTLRRTGFPRNSTYKWPAVPKIPIKEPLEIANNPKPTPPPTLIAKALEDSASHSDATKNDVLLHNFQCDPNEGVANVLGNDQDALSGHFLPELSRTSNNWETKINGNSQQVVFTNHPEADCCSSTTNKKPTNPISQTFNHGDSQTIVTQDYPAETTALRKRATLSGYGMGSCAANKEAGSKTIHFFNTVGLVPKIRHFLHLSNSIRKADILRLTGLDTDFNGLVELTNSTKCGSAKTHFKHKWVRHALQNIIDTSETILELARLNLKKCVIASTADMLETFERQDTPAELIFHILLKANQPFHQLVSLFEEDVVKNPRFLHPPTGVTQFLTDVKSVLILQVPDTKLCYERVVSTVCGIQEYEAGMKPEEFRPYAVINEVTTNHEIENFKNMKIVIIATTVQLDDSEIHDIAQDSLKWTDLTISYRKQLLEQVNVAGVPCSMEERQCCYEILSGSHLTKAIELNYISLEVLERSIKTVIQELSQPQLIRLEDMALQCVLSADGESRTKNDINELVMSPPSMADKHRLHSSYLAARSILRQNSSVQELVFGTKHCRICILHCIGHFAVNEKTERILTTRFKHKFVIMFLNRLLHLYGGEFSLPISAAKADEFAEACCHAKACKLFLIANQRHKLKYRRGPQLHLLSAFTSNLSDSEVSSVNEVIEILAIKNKGFLEYSVASEAFTPVLSPYTHADIITQLADLGANIKASSAISKRTVAHRFTYDSTLSGDQFDKLIKYLINKGVIKKLFNARDGQQQTPLLGMVQKCCFKSDCLITLYSLGIDFTAKDADGNGVMLNTVLGAGAVTYLNVLVDRCGASWGETNLKKQNVLHCASLGGNTETVLNIIHRGFDVNEKDVDGCSPLLVVAKQGFRNTHEVIKLLVSNAADVCATDYKKKSVLKLAKDNSNIEGRTVTFLRIAGAV